MNKITLVALAMTLLLTASAWSQQKSAIELKTAAEVEIVKKNDKGEKTTALVNAEKATKAPGDTIVFTTTYTNTGNKPADAVVITNPVPEHTMYLDQSAGGANTRIDFSVDNGKTYAAPDKLQIKDTTGKMRKAAAGDYTNIRWTLTKTLPAGGTGSVSYKARIK